ncbi:hypothetical protein K0P33_05495 [Pseudomonas sp. ArH3a]|uniref:hypothetical protein n=1 Tax=Pseudomonas sp. ArH3a TaxID=2862945 RepID=UPI001F57A65C|nr:hypothetical protein [Pseudomonas sp. ArH3a]UNM20913.1 hypothetical protein K0P33_05495 [Pseudomonas sp. ArH3a]
MAVPAGPTEKRYTGNGVTTIFTIPFLLLAASDLDVFINGVEVVSGFTITGVGNPTSTITFTAAPPNLSSILLNLNVPFERVNDYQENGDFLSSTVNRDFDRIWQALKQLFRVSTRSLTLGFFDVDGAGAYQAKGNRISGLGSAEGVSSNAATYGDVLQAVSLIPGPGLPINYVATISTMRNLMLTTPAVDNVEYNLREYISGTSKGGGVFYWSAGTLKSKHNGGTIISPSVPFSGLQAALPAFLAGTGETNPTGSGCWIRRYDDLYGEFFGMCGGAYRDPEAFSAAHKFAAQNFTTLHLNGQYYVAGAQVMGGRMLLQGHNNASLTGNLKYICLTFPPAADTTTPVTDTDPYFDSRGMAWKALEGDFALDVQAQYGDKFIDTCNLNKNKFYGQLGFKGTHLIGGVMSDNDFYTTIAGIIQEGCTNWTYSEQRFRQAARYGMIFRPNTANPGRKGGENHKLSLCEFAVCTVGLRQIRTQWCTVDNSLFDYCGLPVWSTGCLYQKYSDTYFGSSKQGSLESMPGYTAPPTVGTAFFSEPYISGTVAGGNAVVEPHSWTAIGCEYVNYTPGVTQPLINSTGFNADQPTGRFSQKVQMSKCKLIAGANHAASQLMAISYCTDVDLDGLVFDSFNKSTTMTDPFFLNTVDTYNVRGTDTYACYQSGVRMFSKYERESLGRLAMVDDTLGLLIQNAAGANCIVVRGSGSDRVDMYVGGSLKSVGVGVTNSGGTGFRALIVPN